MTALANSLDYYYSKTLAESYSLRATDYKIAAVKIAVKHLETASTIFLVKNIINFATAV